MKHKHAEAIKAWADGAEIEVFRPSTNCWHDANPPLWNLDYEYRIKRPNWQQKLIDTAKEGKKVQVFDRVNDRWITSTLNDKLEEYRFGDYSELDFRIKPEPKPDLVKYVSVKIASGEICRWNIAAPAYANLILTFDSETGELKASEVI